MLTTAVLMAMLNSIINNGETTTVSLAISKKITESATAYQSGAGMSPEKAINIFNDINTHVVELFNSVNSLIDDIGLINSLNTDTSENFSESSLTSLDATIMTLSSDIQYLDDIFTLAELSPSWRPYTLMLRDLKAKTLRTYSNTKASIIYIREIVRQFLGCQQESAHDEIDFSPLELAEFNSLISTTHNEMLVGDGKWQ